METVRVIYHHEEGNWWAESPDIERWYAAADDYAAIVKLAEDGIPFALGHEAKIEHFVPADERAPA
jgi:predicted RNase H-like HicB family nuclease